MKSSGESGPKSWIVRGAAIAVTAVPFVHQCAEMHRIAFGRPISRAMRSHARVTGILFRCIEVL